MYYATEVKLELSYLSANIAIGKDFIRQYIIFVLSVKYVSFWKEEKETMVSYQSNRQKPQPRDTLCIYVIGNYRMTSNKGGRKYVMKDKKNEHVY